MEHNNSLDRDLAQQILNSLSYNIAHHIPHTQIVDLMRLYFRMLLQELLQKSSMQFSTPFALLAYLSHQHEIPAGIYHSLQSFRKYDEDIDTSENNDDHLNETAFHTGLNAIIGLISNVFRVPVSEDLQSFIDVELQAKHKTSSDSTYATFIPITILTISEAPDYRMEGYREDEPDKKCVVAWNLSDRNIAYNKVLSFLARGDHLPVRANFFDIEITVENLYRPRGIVIVPDYLMDVTTIAGCFTVHPPDPYLAITGRFLTTDASIPLLTGTSANHILDRLLQDPQTSFDTLIKEVFTLNPILFASLNDAQVKDLVDKCKVHFNILSECIKKGFGWEHFDRDACFLEPSFFSPEFGIQGRLDVLHLKPEPKSAPIIIELKSGKPFRPNAYGVSASHFVQILLYDLLCKNLKPGISPGCYLLYSSTVENPVRFVPTVRNLQMEALATRNEILYLEKKLAALQAHESNSWQIIHHLRPEFHQGLASFALEDLSCIAQTWDQLDEIEKIWFAGFTGFSMREHHIAKIGMNQRQNDAQASLWLSTRNEKQDRWSILSFLVLLEDKSHDVLPQLTFTFSARTPQLSNFRIGDIAVLYPHTGRTSSTHSQVWKCTLQYKDHEKVVLRLRAPQFNKDLFQKYPYWHLEKDVLDSSFLQLTRNVYEFASSPSSKRKLLMGRTPPAEYKTQKLQLPLSLTEEQQRVLSEIISAKDYYLLWGPPGTGKTSQVIRHLTKYLLDQTQEHFMLIAYTNRAVDEICEAIIANGDTYKNQFIRIGSRFATDPQYHERLLETHMAQIRNRDDVRKIVSGCRLFVGTVASIAGKSTLFEIKKFDRIIIDEASQLTEPMICGLLTKFPNFTLIGDHKQLPAVVVQDKKDREILSPELNTLGYQDLGNSFFERLLNVAVNKGWTHAYGMLSAQGRMHQDIMQFPNEFFYNNQLTCISQKQMEALNSIHVDHAFHSIFKTRRIAFIPTPFIKSSLFSKTNPGEAAIVLELVKYFKEHYKSAGMPWTSSTLGIISPFRSQIAFIKNTFDKNNCAYDDITVDTVERFQGGAKDIIIISWCIQSPSELGIITSYENGIDRKLNVALTRARNFMISLGYPQAFVKHPLYQNYIHRYGLNAMECQLIYASANLTSTVDVEGNSQ